VGEEGGFLISIYTGTESYGRKKYDTLSVKINKNKLTFAWILMQNFVPLLYEREIDSFDCVFDGDWPPV
jgi:hypothetical protein